MKEMEDNSVDAVVTDPPYHLTSIVKRFGGENAAPAQYGTNGAFSRASRGFMGKQWDGGDIAQNPALWSEVLRILKPGGHLASFSSTRTYHRMACAIEDAGFEVRDQLAWCYGVGFPKSHDVSKGIDKAAGAEREVVGRALYGDGHVQNSAESMGYGGCDPDVDRRYITAPATDAARQWEGWGTALKPSFEPVCLAQKPLTNKQLITIIVSTLTILEVKLWLTLRAKDAERFSALSPPGSPEEMSAFVQWDAESGFNTRAGLSDQMDMSLLGLATTSSLNTVSSWRRTWAELSEQENTSIIETELSTIIDLKTLKFSLSKITPEAIILAHKTGQWSIANASSAERLFSAAATKLSATLELSAVGSALQEERTSFLDGIGRIGPGLSPICLARKPLSEKTVAANVLRWGTGAINVDGCRIEAGADHAANCDRNNVKGIWGGVKGANVKASPQGRFPANLCHDGSDEVLDLFPETAPARRGNKGLDTGIQGGRFAAGERAPWVDCIKGHDDNGGSAARFFYAAKASKHDRAGSRHPTVKPVKLMQWLVRLITPPGGVVLDPFAGSGTTGAAAILEGFRPILIEREAEYIADIRRRLQKDNDKWPNSPQPSEAHCPSPRSRGRAAVIPSLIEPMLF